MYHLISEPKMLTLAQHNRVVLFLSILVVGLICFLNDYGLLAFVIYVGGLWEVWGTQCFLYEKGPTEGLPFYTPLIAQWRLSMTPENRQVFDMLTDIGVLLIWPVASVFGFLRWLYEEIRSQRY
jgi:hypothetical protein